MLIRQLEYFVAVARERHFARAAAACYVSQPALSDALRKLETELNVPLIKRGHAFEGLTPEGERLVVWARRVLADHDALRSEAETLRAGLSGHLRIGVVPSASTTVAQLVGRFWGDHPLTTISIVSKLSTTEIIRRIRDYELDAGICYPAAGTGDLGAVELYREHEVLIATEELLNGTPEIMTWEHAATYPLAALDASMRGREIMDDAFRSAGVQPNVSVETDSVASLYALVSTGAWASIVPDLWMPSAQGPIDLRIARLIEPTIENAMILVHSNSEPVPPLVRALADTARALNAAFQ